MPTSSSMHDDGFGEVSYSAAERAAAQAKPPRTSGHRSQDWSPPAPDLYGDGRYPATYAGEADESRTARRSRARSNERGISAPFALVVLLVICGIGGLIDLSSGTSVKGGFNIALVIGAIASILVVRRSSMFAVVVAPPIVYFVASATLLYVRSNGLKNRSVLLDAGVNWLVYGFPAIAGATAAVLLIAGVRMVIGK